MLNMQEIQNFAAYLNRCELSENPTIQSVTYKTDNYCDRIAGSDLRRLKAKELAGVLVLQLEAALLGVSENYLKNKLKNFRDY